MTKYSDSASRTASPSTLRTFLSEFLGLFRDMPNRASGEYLEAKSARILRNVCVSSFDAVTETVPFAVDLSSGVWSVALHGTVLGISLFMILGGGLIASSLWGPGPVPVWLGPLGPFPLSSAALGLLACILVLCSRVACDHIGWSLFSFFMPNADSANVVVSNIPKVKHDPDAPDVQQWLARLKASGTRRFVAIVAHYDSARCLPPVKKFFLTPALKNGIGRIPTLACIAMSVCLLATACDAWFGMGLSHGFWGWVALVVFLLGFALVMIEATTAASSSRLPYCPGYNDNLSGCAAAAGAIALTLPPGATEDHGPFAPIPPEARTAISGTGLQDTAFVCAFTGSEENGLHGGFGLAKTALAAAEELFGAGNIFILNLDSVSGPHLRFSSTERSFSGTKRGGNPHFAVASQDYLSGPVLSDTEAEALFTEAERAIFLRRNGNSWGFAVELSHGPLASCTDITALCRSRKLNGKANAFSITSPNDPDGDPLARPRDYHRLSDDYATLMDPATPANFGSVVVLSVAMATLIKAIDRGEFDPLS